MLPPLYVIAGAHAMYVRRHGLPVHRDDARIAEALREAAALAGDRVEDEPLALLYAFTARGRALAAAWEGLPLLLAGNHARRLGVELHLDPADQELLDLRLRIASNRASFDDLRAWAARRR